MTSLAKTSSNGRASRRSEETTPVPDSTTPLGKEMANFCPGLDVLLKQKDGRYYLGTVVEVDTLRDQCLVKFGDNTESWSSFKDLTKLSTPEQEDLLCVVCKKSAPKEKKEITVCDKCGRGYHQKCHQPEIPLECKGGDSTWKCKRCVTSESHSRLRKSDLKHPKQPTSRNTASSSTDVQKSHNLKAFPYDLNCLTWDTYHRVNNEHLYCYCGESGDWYKQMLQCGRCKQWFHERCIDCLQYPLYCGDRFYVFVCSICNHGKEFLRRLEMKWVDLVHLMLFNLTAYNSKKYYDLDTIIIPYINDNWHALQLPPKIAAFSKPARRENILSVLLNNRNRFKCGREIKKRATIWGLRVRLPPPAPTVTLTFSGRVTEAELRETWQGNRRLQFLSLEHHQQQQHQQQQQQKFSDTTTLGHLNSSSSKNNKVVVVPSDGHMKNIMMGVAYQQTSTPSETDSSCASPEVEHEQRSSTLCVVDDSTSTTTTASCSSSSTSSKILSATSSSTSSTGTMAIASQKFYNSKSVYLGAGCAKKTVPFANVSSAGNKSGGASSAQHKRKRLLSVSDRERERISRRPKRRNTNDGVYSTANSNNKTSGAVTTTTGEQSESAGGGGGYATRLSLVDSNNKNNAAASSFSTSSHINSNSSNKVSDTTLPLTPPTSVSAPPTPPASAAGSNSLLSDLSNDFSSEHSNSLTSNHYHNHHHHHHQLSEKNAKIKTTSRSSSSNNNNTNSGRDSVGMVESAELLNTHCDTSGDDETSSKSTLDLIIPPPKDFEGKNNPFLALLRGTTNSNNKNNNSSSNVGGSGAASTASAATEDQRRQQAAPPTTTTTTKKRKQEITLPLPLTAVIPGKPLMRPTKRQLSEKDIFIGPNGEVKRRRFRRSRNSGGGNGSAQVSTYVAGQTASKTATVVPARPDGNEWGQRSPSSSSSSNTANHNNQMTNSNSCGDFTLNGRKLRQRPDRNPQDKEKASTSQSASPAASQPQAPTPQISPKPSPVKQEPDISMDELKSSVNIYFGAANRIAAGERFTVKAKRVGPTGKIEFLIEWEGPANGMT